VACFLGLNGRIERELAKASATLTTIADPRFAHLLIEGLLPPGLSRGKLPGQGTRGAREQVDQGRIVPQRWL
jgi:hypothetical protein